MRKIIYIFILFLILAIETLYGQNTLASPVDIGSKNSSFTYTDTKNTNNYTNNYTGRSTNDVFYKFTITATMDITISHCGSAVADTYVYLLNSSGTAIAYNDDYSGEGACTTTTQSYLKMTNLAAGTYYVVSEGYSQNGNITTKIEGTVKKTELDLGTKSSSFSYTNTQNTATLGNAYSGQSTNDIFYKFTITGTMDIIISHCGSAVTDTYVHLLDASGTRIAYNDDYSGEGACTTTTQSYLKMTNLAAGTYYVVSEGYSQNGNITTKIEGIAKKTELDMGTESSSFSYTDTQNTSTLGNAYSGQSTNDVFYKFIITKAMDITISHCGSAVIDTYVHLLDASGTRIAYNDNYSGEGACTITTQSYLKMTNLAAGTYYVVSEGNSLNGNITTKIEGLVKKTELDLGTKSSSFSYTDTQNTATLGNAYSGQSTNDVFYKFTITKAMNIIISHCGSAVTDTYVHLLDVSGTRIAYNDNYSGEGACTITTQSYLKMTNLAAGTYYVVSEGFSQNGNITTKIEGVVPNLGIGSDDQNYIHTRTYTKEDGTTYLDAIQYFDGLGRPVQVVQKAVTPLTADLVTYQEYDPFGREERSWLPAVATNNNGAYMPLATYKAKAMTTYNSTTYNTVADSVAYSRPVYEASPLNRVLEQYRTGVDWKTSKKAVRTGYLTNIAKSGTTWADSDSLVCGLYKTTDDTKTISLSRTTNYGANELYVIRLNDENENISYEFKDKQGQVILTRQINSGKLYDTNYIYDSSGNLRAVLPPEASDRLLSSSSWVETDTNLKLYAYLYKYDSRNRCIAKKLPGCEWTYYVYDKGDRLIFTQDGEQRSGGKNEWLFSIPDVFGRIVLTGISKDTISVSNKIVKGVYASTGNYKRYNIQVDGVTKTFTNTPGILSANYYDNYDFRGMAEIPTTGTEYSVETGYGTQYTGGYKGLLTGTISAQQLSDGTISSTYLYSVMYYDNRGRLIQSKSNNHLSGGIEQEYIAYNFTSLSAQKKHVHQATGKTTQTEVYVYTYDHAGRLTKETYQLNGATAFTLAENTYDELGRLKTNQKGGVANALSTYGYNIRSWTKSITSPLFTETLYYNEVYGGSKAQYNGNIGAMSWKVTGDTNLRGYAFAYDNLSRLTSANYLKDATVQTNNGTIPIFQTAYNYDKHGNILTLQRYGKLTASTYGLADNLTLTYVGNQMVKVEDSAALISIGESADFKNNSNVTTEYTYNTNGAIKSDLNKGITDIQYNSLNLPSQMVINSSTIKAKNYYTYSALGVKLKTEQRYDPNYSVTPSNTTNPANDGLTDYKNTDYVGNIIYETEKNSAGIVSKTRILIDGGYIESGVYYYYLTDHLGNNRVVVNASGTVIQKNHYYPFGTAFAENTTDEQKKQPYKYNGKELDQMHGLNLYDYSARYYESAVGRFTTVDPLAEMYYSWSPYAHVMNNPLKYVDPTGMYSTAEWKKDNGYTDDDFDTVYEAPKDGEPEKEKSNNSSPIKILDNIKKSFNDLGNFNIFNSISEYVTNIFATQNTITYPDGDIDNKYYKRDWVPEYYGVSISGNYILGISPIGISSFEIGLGYIPGDGLFIDRSLGAGVGLNRSLGLNLKVGQYHGTGTPTGYSMMGHSISANSSYWYISGSYAKDVYYSNGKSILGSQWTTYSIGLTYPSGLSGNFLDLKTYTPIYLNH